MRDDSKLEYLEIWCCIKEYITEKTMSDAADGYIHWLFSSDIIDLGDPQDINDFYGVCDVFDEALKNLSEEYMESYSEMDDEDDE